MNDQLSKKIKLAADKVDTLVNFTKIASKIDNKFVRIVVGSFELVDGFVFKTALTQAVELIPEKAHPVVEGFLDAFITEDYLQLVDRTGAFLTELNLIPVVTTEDQRNVYIALLTAIVRLIPQMSQPDAA